MGITDTWVKVAKLQARQLWTECYLSTQNGTQLKVNQRTSQFNPKQKKAAVLENTMGKDETDLEGVYVTYWERLQHSLFLSFLGVAVCATTTFLIVALAVGHVSDFNNSNLFF